MKFIFAVVTMMLLSFALCLYLPWWTIAPVCFMVSLLIPQKYWVAFLAGFLSLFLLWAGMSYVISLRNEDILAHRMSLLIFKKDSPMMLILFTGLVGGMVGGFSALTGALVRKK